MVTRVHGQPTTIVRLQYVAISAHMGYFLGVDDLKFGHVQISRWALRRGVCRLLAAG